MDKNKHNAAKITLTLGIIGFLAGIGLLFGGNKLIGIFGSIACAGLVLKGYKEIKELKNQEPE